MRLLYFYLAILICPSALTHTANGETSSPTSQVVIAEDESYRAHLAAALASYRLGEPADARRWLDGAPAALRGWEWSFLNALFDQSKQSAVGFSGLVASVAIHPKGQIAAFGLSSGAIVIWNLDTNAKRAEFAGHKGGTFCVRFSPDGARLVSSGVDRVARVWDVESGKVLVEFTEHKFPVAAAMFTPDGLQIASAAYYTDKETSIEGRVHLWDAKDGKIIRTFKGGVKPISSLAISPDGKILAAGSWDSCVFLWDFATPGSPRRLGQESPTGLNIRISSISFSPDGKLLAAGSDFDNAKVYRVNDGSEVATLSDHKSDVNGVAFSPDGARLASCGDDGSVRLWNTRDWSPSATLCGHVAAVRCLAWKPDGTSIVSGGADKAAKQWDAARTDYGGLRATFGRSNYSVAFSPDGALLACCSGEPAVGMIDARTGLVVSKWTTHDGSQACTAAISPDGKTIASCSWDRTIRLFDVKTYAETAKIELPAGVAYFSWQPNGSLIAAALTNNTAVLVDPKERSVVRTFKGHERALTSVAFSPNGRRLATASADSTIRTWDVASGEPTAVMRGHTAHAETCTFTPDGEYVVSGSNDGSVRLWNATSGALVRTLLESDEPINRVAVSPRGCRIAAAGKHLYLLDRIGTGPILKYKPLVDTLWHLSWSPNGQRLAITSWNGEILILDSEGVSGSDVQDRLK